MLDPYLIEEYFSKVVISDKGTTRDHSYLAAVMRDCI